MAEKMKIVIKSSASSFLFDNMGVVFKNTNCCDELVIQTFIANNDKWFSKLYDSRMDDNYCANVRKIDWSRGGPYVWTEKDFNELIDSNLDLTYIRNNLYYKERKKENNKLVYKYFDVKTNEEVYTTTLGGSNE